jgi:hypothetical protein
MTVVPWSSDHLRTDCIALGTENFMANATTNQNSTTNPHDTPQSNSKRVRYAVVGLGYIAQAAVLPAFKHAQENSELVALISDDDTKRAKKTGGGNCDYGAGAAGCGARRGRCGAGSDGPRRVCASGLENAA